MSTSLSRLVDWLHSVGIWWDHSLVQIRDGCSNCSGPALGVFAVINIQENQLLCVIPRTAILSPRTTQLAQILEAEKLGGGLALTIAVMYEASLGQASKWAGYIDSLPAREYLPMFWNEEELQLLAGTGLDGVAAEDRQDTAEDYKQHVMPLMNKYPEAFAHPGLCSLQHFRVAASWVASRSFHVDDWHGDAMVPLADIFNHKASLVLLDDSWQVVQNDRQQQQQQRNELQSHQHELNHSEAQGSEHSNVEAASSEDTPSEQQSDGGRDSEASEDYEESDDSKQSDGENADDQDDPQHGFAVGGMSLTATAGGIVQKAAGCWLRDGVNLRLEIGICSMGPADTAREIGICSMGPADTARTSMPSASAVAAAAGNDVCIQEQVHAHQHTDDCGCDHAGTNEQHQHDGAEVKLAAYTQQQKRSAEACQQEQQKKQRTDGQQQGQQTSQQQQQFPTKRLDIVAASSIASGAEVHNTYGELSNQVLVHKYGFCLPANPFDEVQLGPGWAWLLQDMVKAAGLSNSLAPHIKWLQQKSNLLPDDDAEEHEGEDPPAVVPGGRLPLLVAAVVRVLGLPSSKLKTLDSLQHVLETLTPQADEQQVSNETRKKQTRKHDAGTADNSAANQSAAAAGGMDIAEAVLAEHFEDIQITAKDVSWWGKAGLQVLQQAVQHRLQQYPSKGLCITEDEQTLSHLRSNGQQQQQVKQPSGAGLGGGTVGPHNPGEHVAAVAAAVQLRICEQRILKQALEAVELVLASEHLLCTHADNAPCNSAHQ